MLIYQRILVASQIIWSGLLLFKAKFRIDDVYLLSIGVVAIIIGLYSIYYMKTGNFNIIPKPKERGRLRTKGPYKYLRHPMYFSLLLGCAVFMADHFSILKLSFYLALFVTLVAKIELEERLLLAHFKNYKAYQIKTWKIIPLIY